MKNSWATCAPSSTHHIHIHREKSWRKLQKEKKWSNTWCMSPSELHAPVMTWTTHDSGAPVLPELTTAADAKAEPEAATLNLTGGWQSNAPNLNWESVSMHEWEALLDEIAAVAKIQIMFSCTCYMMIIIWHRHSCSHWREGKGTGMGTGDGRERRELWTRSRWLSFAHAQGM